jgi:protein tyrosine phosphatase (PTP) superfamily phosphohydrolase (DUF442 family)
MSDLNAIRDFLQLTDTIATSGQPKINQFQAIKDAGYESVINLADVGESPGEEAQAWAALGLDYEHIPVVWEQPTLEDAQRVFDAIRERQNKKLYVHCVANRRVSAFMYLYRVTQLGMPEPEARRDLNKLWRPNPTWQRYVDDALMKFTPRDAARDAPHDASLE